MTVNDLTIAVFSCSGHQYLLPYCLRSIYSNSPAHREIILVWDDFIDWYPIDFDQMREHTGINFRLVLQSEICAWPESIVRWGWVKQQLAKLLCYQYSRSNYTWIVDGDVLITGDPKLFCDGRPILRYNEGYPVPLEYKFFMERYLGIRDFNSHSFVGSTALFEHEICKDIERLCVKNSNMDLVASVDHMLNSKDHPDLPFSEFEYHGHLAQKQPSWISARHNWNHVQNGLGDWSAPIQIAWAQPDHDLEKRYQNLMQYKHPETLDQ